MAHLALSSPPVLLGLTFSFNMTPGMQHVGNVENPILVLPCTTGSSTRPFPPRVASTARYARSQGRIERNIDGEDGVAHGFRCKLTTLKFQELHAPGYQPGRRIHTPFTTVKNIPH